MSLTELPNKSSRAESHRDKAPSQPLSTGSPSINSGGVSFGHRAPKLRQGSVHDQPQDNSTAAGADMQSHPLYDPLRTAATSGPLTTALELDGPKLAGKDFPVKLLQDVMATSQRQFNVSDAITSKVRGQMLMLDNPSRQQSAHGRQRENQQARRLLQKLKSRTQRKKMNINSGQLTSAKYSWFLGLNEKWNEYASRLIEQNPRESQEALATTTFIGSQLKVIQSRRVQSVGQKGIIVWESAAAFQIVTTEDKLKVLPKRGSMFECTGLPRAQRIHIYGDTLCQ
mmetsp:Transcript_24709/g.68786  ORF Transcript_24709/g.68786 Transcript_24709/m.68786 type:complete len:284 (+) Transcript_24709:343-1194(+)